MGTGKLRLPVPAVSRTCRNGNELVPPPLALGQVRLDALKSAIERNKWGQFATPSPLAISLARYARTLMADERVRFLDPAIGTGSFFSALLNVYDTEDIT